MLSRPCPPNPELEDLLEKARGYTMTPAERREQMVSFVYGNLMDATRPPTKDHVRQLADEVYGKIAE